MMLYVDDRVGSKELYPLFPKGTAELTHLEYADVMFTGHHAEGDIVVGVERKRIGDFVNSMCSGRLSGRQLIGLLNSYHHVYIVIEGVFRANPQSGILEVYSHRQWQPHHAGNRTFMARDIWAFMNTIEVVCGVHCYHCSIPSDTAHYVMALHHWWTKEYTEHKGHLQAHTGPVVDISRQSLVRRVAAQLDGIGWEKAKEIDLAFGSVVEMAMADEKDFAMLKGIGKTLSRSIVDQLRGTE